VVGCDNKHIDDALLYQAFVNTYNALIDNKDALIKKWKELLESENVWLRVTANRLIELFKDAKPIAEFDSSLFQQTIEKMTVNDSNKVTIILLDGTNIECEIE